MIRSSKIKLLIVDDSALMRRQLKTLFEAEGGFIIQLARNGKEAIDKNLSFEPDVVTLDINMPEMDGLTALSLIMNSRKVPVVMVSSLSEKGALATFEALALGAVDYIAKPSGTISLSISEIEKGLVSKVKSAANANLKSKLSQLSQASKSPRQQVRKASSPPTLNFNMLASKSIIVVGVSTGGPGTLEEIIGRITPNFLVPIIIAQHMPASFTAAFAERLNKVFPFNISEVNRPMTIEPGSIYIAKGGADMMVTSRAKKLMVVPKPESSNYLWHPSVELLGRSALEHYKPENIVGVMLTGMGNDGAEAFAEIKRRGGHTIAESEESSIVFGMPKELIAKGGASKVLHAHDIAGQLERWCM